MMSLAVYRVWLPRACGNELHPEGQTLYPYGLLISGRKWKSCHMTKSLRPVRFWNQLSGNGQMGPSPMTKNQSLCLNSVGRSTTVQRWTRRPGCFHPEAQAEYAKLQ